MPPKPQRRDRESDDQQQQRPRPVQQQTTLDQYLQNRAHRGGGGGGRGGGGRGGGGGGGRGNNRGGFNNNNNNIGNRSNSGTPAKKPRSQTPCNFYTGAPGSCIKGDNCDFAHDPQLQRAASGTGNNNRRNQNPQRSNNNDDSSDDDPFALPSSASANSKKNNNKPNPPPQKPNQQQQRQQQQQQQPPQRQLSTINTPSQLRQILDANGGAPAAAAPATAGGAKRGKQQQQQGKRNNAPPPGLNTVFLPWDPTCTFDCPFSHQQRPVWAAAEQLLSERCNSIADFLGLLASTVNLGNSSGNSNNMRKKTSKSFPTLDVALRTMPDQGFINKFLATILPTLQEYVLLAPRLLPDPIPILAQNSHNSKVVLTQLQCTVLLAIGFFGLFPGVPEDAQRDEQPPGANLTPLYSTQGPSTAAKLQCILGYFETVTCDPIVVAEREATVANNNAAAATTTSTAFKVEFIRVAPPAAQDMEAALVACFENSNAPLTQLTLDDAGVIESNNNGMLQADFANRCIGGGVLNHGCVQEEIRFVVSPELLLSRLVVEDLLAHETVVMSGSLMYTRYSGYGYSFRYAGRISPLPAPTPAEIQAGVRDVAVVAFDAIDFSPRRGMYPDMQYRSEWVMRELIKAYVAFMPIAGSDCPSARDATSPIATGNWGCGVFKGDLELKFILQLCAASQLGRPVVYFTFGNSKLNDNAQIIYDALKENKVTVGRLVELVMQWSNEHEEAQDEEAERQEQLVFMRRNSGGNSNSKKGTNNVSNNKKSQNSASAAAALSISASMPLDDSSVNINGEAMILLGGDADDDDSNDTIDYLDLPAEGSNKNPNKTVAAAIVGGAGEDDASPAVKKESSISALLMRRRSSGGASAAAASSSEQRKQTPGSLFQYIYDDLEATAAMEAEEQEQ